MKAIRIRQFLRLLFLLAICGLLLVGCGQKGPADGSSSSQVSQAGKPSNREVYTIADPAGDWGFPSPYGHYDRGPGILRMSFLFDTLIWRDAEGFVPALAGSWEYIGEETAYLFELRPNVTWHDGEPFTAEDVAFTFRYLEQHPYSLADISMVAAVEVLDDYRLKVKLHEPSAPFLTRVAGAVPILPEHIWQSVENPKEFNRPEAVIGTGPYKLADYNREQGSYLYLANEDYYLGVPLVKQLRFVKLNPQLAGAALLRGEINYTPIPPDMLAQLQDKDVSILKADNDWALKLMFNHTKEPFSSKEFRQGLAYAIDRQELVDITKRGFGLAGSPGLLSETSAWYNGSVMAYEYDQEKALSMFRQAGYYYDAGKLVKNGEPVVFTLLFDPDTERESQLLKSQLERVGIELQLRSVEAKTRDSLVLDWQFELALLGHGGLGTDPSFYTQVIVGPSFHSARYTANEQLNSLIKDQLKTMDRTGRLELLSEIQEIYAEEMPSLTLYYPDNYFAHDGQIELYNTWQGVATGVPLPLNKLAFVTGGGTP
jgi:peptide/nickel transport system substrate-binding protein